MKSLSKIIKSLNYDVRHLSPRVRFLVVIQLAILFILSILIGVIFSPKFAANVVQNTNAPSPSDNRSTMFVINPSEKIIRTGDTINFAVTVEKDFPQTADIALMYDVKFLQFVEANSGNAFNQEIVKEIKNGRIIYAAAEIPRTKTDPERDRTILNLSFKALRPTEQTELVFDATTTIAGFAGDDILSTPSGSIVRIFD